MSNFKVGDKVYFPEMGGGIFELFDSPLESYPLRIKGAGTFDVDGKLVPTQEVQSIFHATKENKAKLEALYGIEFDEPAITGSELTKKLLADGHSVLCFVSDGDDCDAIKRGVIRMVVEFKHGCFFSNVGAFWKYAIPVGKDFKFSVGD